MNPFRSRRREVILAALLWVSCTLFAIAADEPTLSKEQTKQFLLTAKVTNSRAASKGVTHSWRLRSLTARLRMTPTFNPLMNTNKERSLASALS